MEEDEHDLIIAETITLVPGEESSFSQSITQDVHTDFSFYVSHASGVFYVSLESWIRQLETELSQPQTEGIDFRVQRVLESTNSSVERLMQRKISGNPAEQDVTSAVIIEDGNVGYFLLTSVNNEPHAALVDAPESNMPTEDAIAEFMHIEAPPKEVREAWQPPKELYEPIDLLSSISIPQRHRLAMKEEVKLSPSNLELLMSVHRNLSKQTFRLQTAVSDLFNRATRLQEEFRDQVWRTALVTAQIDAVTGKDDAQKSASVHGSSTDIDERLEKVRTRQEKLNTRYEALRSKVNKLSTSQLSEKETNLIDELTTMDGSIDKSTSTLVSDTDGSQTPAWQRVEKLKDLKQSLSKQVDAVAKMKPDERRNNDMKVPSHSRKQENEQIHELLARNGVLVVAATERLRTLGIAIPVSGEK